MEILKEILFQAIYRTSNALLIPDMAGLVGLTVWSIMEVGGFVQEFVARRRNLRHWVSFIDELQAKPNPPEHSVMRFFETSHYPGFLSIFAATGRNLASSSILMSRLIASLEIDANSRLSRMSFGIRVGPMLGLMGTLIPLGPALTAMGSGNTQELARNLVVAFATTVVGLFVGGVCYVMSLARRKWYAQDLADIEYLYQCLFVTERRNYESRESDDT